MIYWRNQKEKATIFLKCTLPFCFCLNEKLAITKHLTLNPLLSFTATVHTLVFRSNDSSHLLPVAFSTPFWASHEYIHVFTKGKKKTRCVWVVRGVSVSAREVFTACGRSRPLEPLAPDRALQGPSCPGAESYLPPEQKQIKQCSPAPRVCWKMTGRDIVPSGHSQLTAINYTTQGKYKERSLWKSVREFFSHAKMLGNYKEMFKVRLYKNKPLKSDTLKHFRLKRWPLKPQIFRPQLPRPCQLKCGKLVDFKYYVCTLGVRICPAVLSPLH